MKARGNDYHINKFIQEVKSLLPGEKPFRGGKLGLYVLKMRGRIHVKEPCRVKPILVGNPQVMKSIHISSKSYDKV